MLDKVLNAITDSEDYLTAISLFQAKKPMTKEETEKMLAVYARYVPGGEEPEYARACMAVDLLSGRTEEERTWFAPLELGEKTVDALFIVKTLLNRNREAAKEETQEVLETVRDEEVRLWARVLLARTALNTLAFSRDLVDIREEVTALAEFLTGCGGETLNRYVELVREARVKCRM